jgi:hypothetical protein
MKKLYSPTRLYFPEATGEMMAEMAESVGHHTPLGAFLEAVLVRYGNIQANVYEDGQWKELADRNLVDSSKTFVIKGMRVDRHLE